MVNHDSIRLGRKPGRHDPRAPTLARYLLGFPAAPDIVDYWGKLASLGMMTSPDWRGAEGFDYARLRADMVALRAQP